MKRHILYSTLITITLSIMACVHITVQQQLDKTFGKYVEDDKPENRKFYKAYNKALKLWKTPYGEVNIKTRFGKAHVMVSGPDSGEVLVLLHGMNATSTMWYPNIKELSKNYRVYAIDHLMEPGKSEQTSKVNNMEEMMHWYDEIFKGLKLQEFSIVGASKGGWLAVYIALQHKYQIKNMILLSPAQTFVSISPDLDILANITYSLNPKRKNLKDVLETMSVNVQNIKQAYIDQYFIATQKASIDKFILQMRPYSDEELQSLTMPILVLVGDQDIINNQESIDRAKKLLPHVYAETIKNAGHFLSIDKSKIVNTKMLTFLD